MTKKQVRQAQQVPLDELHTAEWNPRSHSDERLHNLCYSIKEDPEFLWRRPILAQADGTIYAGNLRFLAAQQLGLESVPAIVEDVPDRLARERAIRDNSQWGEWDDDRLAVALEELSKEGSEVGDLGFDDEELQELFQLLEATEGLVDPDEVVSPPEEPTTQRSDLIILGEHRVLCGDSTNAEDVARLMNGETATLMATDPPYLVDYTAAAAGSEEAHWDEFQGAEQAAQFYLGFLQVALQHLGPRAPIYQWHAHRRQTLVEQAWREAGLLPHQQLIWVKANGVPGRSHFMWQHEPCLYGWREGKMPRRRPPNTDTTVWHVDHRAELEGAHPTQKPVELFRRPIEYHTQPREVCYEPFLGSGTQLIAAEQTGRRCFGMELDPGYVDAIVARWERFTGKQAQREPRG